MKYYFIRLEGINFCYNEEYISFYASRVLLAKEITSAKEIAIENIKLELKDQNICLKENCSSLCIDEILEIEEPENLNQIPTGFTFF